MLLPHTHTHTNLALCQPNASDRATSFGQVRLLALAAGAIPSKATATNKRTSERRCGSFSCCHGPSSQNAKRQRRRTARLGKQNAPLAGSRQEAPVAQKARASGLQPEKRDSVELWLSAGTKGVTPWGTAHLARHPTCGALKGWPERLCVAGIARQSLR